MKRKITTLLLALVLVLSVLPTPAWAAVIEEGFGAEGTKFRYDTGTKTMTISGNGVIPFRDFGSVYYDFGFSISEVKKVVIKSGVTKIGDHAFHDFYSMTSITIPNTVTHIGKAAFYYCRSLSAVTLPTSLRTIDSSAFYQCYALKSITIPAKVTGIGTGAFYQCDSLKTVTFKGNAPEVLGSGSRVLPGHVTAYYPAGNATWTEEARDSLGDSGVKWVAVCTGEHSYGNWTDAGDGSTHKRACTACGKEETADHSWDKGTTITAPTCQATGEASFTCTGCGAAKTEILPVGDHPYSPWEKVDDQTHTHTCTVCAVVETADHSWDKGKTIKAANCIADGEMKYTCTGCGLTRTEVVPMNGIHTYDHGCDTDCNICGAVRTTQHKYSADWTGNKSGHWHKCVHCGEKQAVLPHTPGPEATEQKPQLCSDCGYTLKPVLTHQHVFADTLSSDETGHWYACDSCDEQKDLAGHVYDHDCDTACNDCGFARTTEHVWSDAWTGDETGHFHGCTVCGERKDVTAHELRFGTCGICAYEDPNYDPTPVILAAGGGTVGVVAIAAAAVWKLKKKKAA